MKTLTAFLVLLLLGTSARVSAQFSPGELSKAHAHLEGNTKCIQCHDVGARISETKCLKCHEEISSLVRSGRGYHASTQVRNKGCIQCHSEHHGRDFDATRFDIKGFNHNLTGYKLQGRHAVVECGQCHRPDKISDGEIRKRQGTYLGLESACLSCHDDDHQGTLGKRCDQCHGFDRFEGASRFSHANSKFPLSGAHKQVSCDGCHKTSTRNGKQFRQFAGVAYSSCSNCHADPHDRQFGDKCSDCHSTAGWKQLKANNRFNHGMTSFPLTGMHAALACEKCHKKGGYSLPVPHDNCFDCHDDYHEGEFNRDGNRTDCRQCHEVDRRFSYSTFGIGEHQSAGFILDGAHAATPCFECHKRTEDDRWSFSFNSKKCVACHADNHQGRISPRFYPEQDCRACHSTGAWAGVTFDHGQTSWPLEGKHAAVSCRKCHYRDEGPDHELAQVFNGLPNACSGCHTDAHGRQFEANGTTDCSRCHAAALDWTIGDFDHSLTKFPLTGMHKTLDCSKCHKPDLVIEGNQFILYKIKKYKCADCHTS